MEGEKIYSFSGERLWNVTGAGFERNAGRLVFLKEGFALLPCIDSGRKDALWGRLYVDMELSPKALCSVSVAATNVRPPDPAGAVWDKTPGENPLQGKLPGNSGFPGTLEFVNQEDMLLYELKGRYLLILIAVKGEGSKSVGEIKVYERGDFLMELFPEIYRKRNSVLHRYLSVFSTLCQDMEEKIDRLPELFMPEKAPADMLPVLAEWMGLDVRGGFLPEEVLRALVKEAYSLSRTRGTKESLCRLTELLIGERPLVVERNLISFHGDRVFGQLYNRLYGEDRYGVTVMLPEEKNRYKKSQLLFLMNQMKPARCSLRLVILKKTQSLTPIPIWTSTAAWGRKGRCRHWMTGHGWSREQLQKEIIWMEKERRTGYEN